MTTKKAISEVFSALGLVAFSVLFYFYFGYFGRAGVVLLLLVAGALFGAFKLVKSKMAESKLKARLLFALEVGFCLALMVDILAIAIMIDGFLGDGIRELVNLIRS